MEAHAGDVAGGCCEQSGSPRTRSLINTAHVVHGVHTDDPQGEQYEDVQLAIALSQANWAETMKRYDIGTCWACCAGHTAGRRRPPATACVPLSRGVMLLKGLGMSVFLDNPRCPPGCVARLPRPGRAESFFRAVLEGTSGTQ